MMAALALCCTLLVCAGVCVAQELLLPAKLNGAVGGNMVFTPISLPPPSYSLISWAFKGTNIITAIGDTSSTAPEYIGRVSLDTTSLALELRNLTMEDAGNYALTIQGSFTVRKETSLEVFAKLSGGTLIGSTDFIIEGNSTNLTCTASGTIASVEWMKDNLKLSPSNTILFSANNRSVWISPVRRTDSGEYRCALTNPVSSDTSAYIMTVNYGPDNLKINGPSEIEEGKAVTLLCVTESVPEAFYTWKFNGTETEMTTASFTVEQANATHSGNYTCTAWNYITRQEDSVSHILAIKGSLEGPQLSAGVKAAIVIGVLFGVVLIAALIFYFVKTK